MDGNHVIRAQPLQLVVTRCWIRNCRDHSRARSTPGAPESYPRAASIQRALIGTDCRPKSAMFHSRTRTDSASAQSPPLTRSGPEYAADGMNRTSSRGTTNDSHDAPSVKKERRRSSLFGLLGGRKDDVRERECLKPDVVDMRAARGTGLKGRQVRPCRVPPLGGGALVAGASP